MTAPILSPIPDGYKRCSKCGEAKLRDEFPAAKGCRDGLRGCCKACKRANDRARYASNPEPARERTRAWRQENIDRAREYDREYNKAHSEKKRNRTREWREANPDRARENVQRWREANPERVQDNVRKWRTANIDHLRTLGCARAHRRRARKRGNGGNYTTEDLAAIRAAQTDKRGRLICWRCGKPITGTPHLDHWIPLDKGGTNDAGNLHYMHAKCNQTKSAKMPTEIGRLL